MTSCSMCETLHSSHSYQLAICSNGNRADTISLDSLRSVGGKRSFPTAFFSVFQPCQQIREHIRILVSECRV